jgi:hypothetical protein
LGALVGFLVTLLTTLALLEISTTAFFAVMLGGALICLSLVILARVLSATDSRRSSFSKYFVVGFALMVFAAGVFCFVLEKNWFTGLTPSSKVPMYALLGGALAFALTFTIVDVLNCISAKCGGPRPSPHVPIVGSSTQICVVLLASLCCGLYFGLLFGSLDVEDDDKKHTRYHKSWQYSMPVGILLGAVVGAVNILTTKTRHEYDPLSTYNDPSII